MTVDGRPGLSLMEILRDADVAEPFALCGGACSCATCHVYIDDAALSRLPAMSPEEDAVLDGSSFRQANSRLSCQVRYTDQLDGSHVTIAPAE